MAKEQPPKEEKTPEFSDADKARARQWFKKAAETRDRREYDYAIECYITGLASWPAAVEEAYMPLRALSIQRQQAGGKKPGMLDEMKKPISGKDAKQALLNAILHWAKDPRNGKYTDAALKNAIKAGYLDVARWVAPLAIESARSDAKPTKARFQAIQTSLTEGIEKAELRGAVDLAVFFLEQALHGLEFLIGRLPTDATLRDDVKLLSSRLTILKGKYSEAESFRESIQDADAQKRLHDTERVMQSDETQGAALGGLRQAYLSNPTPGPALNAYLDALLRVERKAEEDEGIEVLTRLFESTRNYSFKMRADDTRIRQATREARRLTEEARRSGSAEDEQQARLAALEQRELVVEVYRERVSKYPTDLRMKFKLGEILFQCGEYDEAIPVLQAAQHEPRTRVRSKLLMGRAFFERGAFGPASEVLKEGVEEYELTDDLANDLLYWWGRASESAGHKEMAKAAYGRLLRQDYNYKGGEVRDRLKAVSA